MPRLKRPYIDFQEVKRLVPLPDAMEVLGVLDRFERTGDTLTGPCPLPQHQHGPYPNAEQFKATIRDGVWVWHDFGDCQRGGDVVEFCKAMLGYSNADVRLWFAEHFGDRLSLKPPKGEPQPPEKAAAREVLVTPPRAKSKQATETVSPAPSPIKPLRFHLKLETDVPYLRQRGVLPATVERFGLGLCRKGMLAGYVAIPVYRYPKDETPVAYLGRWPGDDHSEQDGRPRYRWPTGFPKQRFVYGLAEAMETPTDEPLFCVEGPFSVYHLVQSGIPASVAIFGSSLSDDQANLLVATGRRIVLMFDGDEAGQAGMRKAAGKLITRAFVRVVKLAEGVQPDGLSPVELRSFL